MKKSAERILFGMRSVIDGSFFKVQILHNLPYQPKSINFYFGKTATYINNASNKLYNLLSEDEKSKIGKKQPT